MYEIVGLCKKSLKWVCVAVASNKKELAMILIEEGNNYFGLRFQRIR
jgi:hypothetical protein